MKQTLNNNPKLYNKNGDLTAYAFACGYIQWASKTGKEIDHWDNGKRMYLDGAVYHVKHFKERITVLWESYDTLREARDVYNRLPI